jgi:hypothetical protein
MDDDLTAAGRADDALTVVRLRGPADILGVLPYRLGFHPSESLVLVCLEGRRRRDRLVMRVDLPEARDDEQVAADLAARVRHVGASAVVAVVYTEVLDGRRLARAGLVTALSDALAAAGVELPEALLVRDGRWWSFLCDRPDCCPADGTPLPTEPTPAATRYAAEAVAQGGSVLSDREQLRRTVEPSDHAVARVVREQAADAADEVLTGALQHGGLPAARALTLSRLAALRTRWDHGDHRVAADDAALVVLGLRDKQARDEAMTAVLDGDVESLVGLLGELARLADDLDAAPVCTVLAWVAYTAGNGALAAIAAERAVRVEPGYTMAELLLDGMDRMVPPDVLRQVSAQVRADLRTDDDERSCTRTALEDEREANA